MNMVQWLACIAIGGQIVITTYTNIAFPQVRRAVKRVVPPEYKFIALVGVALDAAALITAAVWG